LRFFVPAELFALTCAVIFVIFILEMAPPTKKKEAPRQEPSCHCEEAEGIEVSEDIEGEGVYKSGDVLVFGEENADNNNL
jgi:hypothetical protein